MWTVIDGLLYLGTINDACTPAIIIQNQITHFINLTSTKIIVDESFEILHLPLKDSLDENITQYFDETNRFICECEKANNGRCLVFCKHARSRSVTIVLAYLIKHHQHSLKSAYRILDAIHPKISPNTNYFKQLHAYSCELDRSVSPFIH